jgi:putative acetyltransferase
MNIINFANQFHYPQLLQVWEASVRATHHFLNEADIEHYKPLILNEYFDQLNLYYTTAEAQLTGFMGMSGNHIQLLFIHPSARRQGIGTAFIDFAKATFPQLTVDVNEQNTQAVNFYKKLGFETIGLTEMDSAGKPFPVLTMKLG